MYLMSMTLRREPPDGELGHAARFVGRVVEHLDLEKLARIIDGAHRGDQPIGDVHFVVQRQLNRHDRLRIERRAGLRLLIAITQIEINEVVPMPAVDGENDEDEKVCAERQRLCNRHVPNRATYITVGVR